MILLKVTSEDGLEYEAHQYRASIQSLDRVWKRHAEHGRIILDDRFRTPENLFHFLLAKNTIVLDIVQGGKVVALACIWNVFPGNEADFSFDTVDSRMKGRHKLVLGLVDWAFQEFELNRINFGVVGNAFSALSRYRKIGFKFEGLKRRCIYRNNRWSDLFQLGVLRSELTEEAIESGTIERDPEEADWYKLLVKENVNVAIT